MKTIFLTLFTASFLSIGLQAAKIQNVNFEDKTNVGETELVLNGMGIRKATFFKVKAYVSALYLTKKSSDPAAIASDKGVKKIEMEFLMGLQRNQLTDAWDESLTGHCPEDCKELREGLAKMNSYMKNVRKKDRFSFIIHPKKVEVSIKGEKKEDIKGASFSQALLKVFIGPKAIDSGMAKGLLGN